MNPKVNAKLTLVIPIVDDEGEIQAYAHSTPISREVFEANFMLISQTFAAVFADGLGAVAGPRVAAMLLTEIATRNGNVAKAVSLRNEIRRLTNVLVPSERGWEMIPFDQATHAGVDEGDIAEIENAIVFFTVVWSMHRKPVAKALMTEAARLWGAQTSPLDLMAFSASLKTSTAKESSGESPKPAASSVPF